LATAAAAAPRPALAAAPAGAGTAAADLRTTVGSCDSQKLLSDYKGGTRAGDEVRDFATSVRRTADQLRTNGAFLLPEAEARELTTLLQRRELATLQKKQSPTTRSGASGCWKPRRSNCPKRCPRCKTRSHPRTRSACA
jgi:hypothetical protein